MIESKYQEYEPSGSYSPLLLSAYYSWQLTGNYTHLLPKDLRFNPHQVYISGSEQVKVITPSKGRKKYHFFLRHIVSFTITVTVLRDSSVVRGIAEEIQACTIRVKRLRDKSFE